MPCAPERGRTSCEGEKGCFVGPVSSTTGSVRGYLGLLTLSIRLPETLCPGVLEPLEACEVTLR